MEPPIPVAHTTLSQIPTVPKNARNLETKQNGLPSHLISENPVYISSPEINKLKLTNLEKQLLANAFQNWPFTEFLPASYVLTWETLRLILDSTYGGKEELH